MKTADFAYELPRQLVAQTPLKTRTASKLLVYQRMLKATYHKNFYDLPLFLQAGDLLVMNDSKVMPARFFGEKATGGKVSFLIERIIDVQNFLAQVKTSKALQPGSIITLQDPWQVTIIAKSGEFYHAKANGDVLAMLSAIGHVPLPPYINRSAHHADVERYQTVYANNTGSVAAPTAGLHFDHNLLQQLKALGISVAFTTLHVASGTFKPVRCTNIIDHKMHGELYTISDAAAADINQAKQDGRRVIAVGTTAMRTLEAAASHGRVTKGTRETQIFIYPGYNWQICDGLITNFHLPESTLLMLVAAFVGYAEIMHLYKLAVEQQYRFFSYGDACLFL